MRRTLPSSESHQYNYACERHQAARPYIYSLFFYFLSTRFKGKNVIYAQLLLTVKLWKQALEGKLKQQAMMNIIHMKERYITLIFWV